MSKNVAVFIDVANLYYSARGQDVDVDYVALLKAATKGRDLIRAYAYSGLDPENENQRKFIDFLSKNGYKVVHKDIRKFGDGRMKANLDIELVVDLFRLQDRMDIAVIVSGDGDFAPAIRALQDVGVRCEVISFRPNTSSDLIAVADEFFDIMKIIDIGRKKEGASSSRHMSAPEMPAKEVNPEFGFREASPHVAAAALAAIKTNGGRRGRSASTATASTASTNGGDHAAAPAATETANGDESHEASRRRRRRGGRGRGRGRREENGAEITTTDEPTAEVAWQELDDISQVEGIDDELVSPEDREITFSEADADTLAELGISQDSAAASAEADAEPRKPARRRGPKAAASAPAGEAEAADDGEPAKPARRRRSTRASADAGEADDEAAAVSDAPVVRRRRTPKPKSDESTAAPATADEAPAKPASRRRSPKAAADQSAPSNGGGSQASAESSSGEEPQGIWQRFRSARTTR